MDTLMVPTGATIGRTTIDKDGGIHIKTPGKQTPGMMELNQVIGSLMQAPDPDGMREEVGPATMPHATRQLKEITQQRVFHTKMST